MTTTASAKYIYQLGPMADIELATFVRALAAKRGVSMSIVARELIEAGRATLGAGERPTARELSDARVWTREYGERQRERRNQGSARRRAATAGTVPTN